MFPIYLVTKNEPSVVFIALNIQRKLEVALKGEFLFSGNALTPL